MSDNQTTAVGSTAPTDPTTGCHPPGKGVPAEVRDLQSLAELDALWDLRDIYYRGSKWTAAMACRTSAAPADTPQTPPSPCPGSPPFRDTSSSTSCMKLATSGGNRWISLSLRPSLRKFSSRKKGCGQGGHGLCGRGHSRAEKSSWTRGYHKPRVPRPLPAPGHTGSWGLTMTPRLWQEKQRNTRCTCPLCPPPSTLHTSLCSEKTPAGDQTKLQSPALCLISAYPGPEPLLPPSKGSHWSLLLHPNNNLGVVLQ